VSIALRVNADAQRVFIDLELALFARGAARFGGLGDVKREGERGVRWE
jgi:hypothetical protein